MRICQQGDYKSRMWIYYLKAFKRPSVLIYKSQIPQETEVEE